MRGRSRWAFGAALALLAFAPPAAAQVHVDLGVATRHAGARVVIGDPHGHVVERYYEPVYVRHDRRWDRERRHEWAKRQREHDKDMRDARREFEKDRREAEREYWKNVREAEREYEKDRREAWRDRDTDRREAWRDRRR